MFPDRRLGLRWPAAAYKNEENARTDEDAQRARADDLRRVSPARRPRHHQCHFSAGGAERKLAYRASQNHAQAQSGANHSNTPKPQRPAYHRAALRFTPALASLDLGVCLGRPFTTKTISKQDWQRAQRANSSRPIPMRQ